MVITHQSKTATVVSNFFFFLHSQNQKGKATLWLTGENIEYSVCRGAYETLVVECTRKKIIVTLRPEGVRYEYYGQVINRGYYMAPWGCEFYLRVLKVSLTSERSVRCY